MGVPDKVVLHPLVLLSVVDHYNRVAKDTKKRVVGVLLGDTYKGQVDVTNSFAVPFEEDDQDPTIWFLDHSYLENMAHMFKKINGERSAQPRRSRGRQRRSRRSPRGPAVHVQHVCARTALANGAVLWDRARGVRGACSPRVGTRSCFRTGPRIVVAAQGISVPMLSPACCGAPQLGRRWWAGTARGRGCARRTWTSTS